MDVSKFKDIFISEVEDHLQKLNDNLLALEKTIKAQENKDNQDLLNELMRSAHTIKSSSATMGYQKMAFLTHVLEDVFDYARNGALTIEENIINEAFKAIDALEKSLAQIKEKNEEIDVSQYSEKIKAITKVATDGIGKSVRTEDGKPIAIVKKEENNKANVAKEEKDVLANVDLKIEKISHIKVPIKRLDDLMDLAEELLIEKMRLNSLVEVKVETIADIAKKAVLEPLTPAIEHLNNLVASLQFSVMQARLVPVGQIFARFPRMVRDLASENKKEIEFTIIGESLEVDRGIIDKLGEPLMHLLRNAVDHGIEGKGEIKLEAKRENDYVSIIVEDNGQGINWTKLVEVGTAKGIISAEVGQKYLADIKEGDRALWQPILEKELLFTSNLSTKDKVTELSGRGVGTGVVKNFVEEIGGEIIVTSPVANGKGTRFALNLPLTLAIINALLVKIKNETFAIPFASIDRAVFIEAKDIKSVADQDVAVVGEIEVPLIALDKLFNLNTLVKPDIKNKETKKDVVAEVISDKKNVILVKRGAETAGLIIDSLLIKQEIIVKPLPTVLRGVKGFSGSTILGNGKSILILDVISLLQNIKKLTRN